LEGKQDEPKGIDGSANQHRDGVHHPDFVRASFMTWEDAHREFSTGRRCDRCNADLDVRTYDSEAAARILVGQHVCPSTADRDSSAEPEEQPVDIDGAVTQRAVDELFEVYNRQDNSSGPGLTSPAGFQLSTDALSGSMSENAARASRLEPLPMNMDAVQAQAMQVAADAYQKRYNMPATIGLDAKEMNASPGLPRVEDKMCECGHVELDHDEPPDQRMCFGFVGPFTLCSCLDFKAKP
jgi:hypothetical protein